MVFKLPSLIAGAVKNTVAQMSSPIEQADMSNWAPGPVSSPTPPGFSYPDVSAPIYTPLAPVFQPSQPAAYMQPTYAPPPSSYDINADFGFMPSAPFEDTGSFYDYTTPITPGGFQTEWGGNTPVQNTVPEFLDYSDPGGFNTGFGSEVAPVFDFSEPAAPGMLDFTDYSFLPPQEPGGFNTEWGNGSVLDMSDDGEYIQGPYQSGGPSGVLDFPQDAWKAYTGTDILGTAAGLADDFTQPVQDYNQFIQDNARDNMFENGGMSFFDQMVGGGGERIQNATGFDINDIPGPGIIGDTIDATLSPASLLTAGAGGAAGQALRRLPLVGRAAANLVEPVTGSGFIGGLAGEAALNAGATGGAELANEYLPEDMNPLLRSGLVTGAGLLGGGVAAGGLTAAGVPVFDPKAGMVFGTGRTGTPRTVIPDSGALDYESPAIARRLEKIEELKATPEWIAGKADVRGTVANLEAQISRIRQEALARGEGSVQPLANERLWFHSTNDNTFDLLDPDKAVGTATGITQGPGVYMAADPAKSAGRYGNRTFVSEFDGKVLDLTKPTGPMGEIFEGGPTWNDVRMDLLRRLDDPEQKQMVAEAFNPERLRQASMNASADLKGRSPAEFNGYVYRQALIDSLEDAGDPIPDAILGRFATVEGDEGTRALAAVQSVLAENGVDALFHHSPRADGDVLIVLNGQAARTLGETRNAADIVSQGKSWPEIVGETRKAAKTNIKLVKVERAGVDVWKVENAATHRTIGEINPTYDGKFSVYRGGQHVGTVDTLAEARGMFAREPRSESEFFPQPEVKSYGRAKSPATARLADAARAFIDGETGSGNILAAGMTGAARAIGSQIAPTAVGAGLGAAVGGYFGEDMDSALEGAAIGAGAGFGFGAASKVANAAASRGVKDTAIRPEAPQVETSKLVELIKGAKPVRAETERLKSAELGRRAGRVGGQLGGGRQGFYGALGSMKGELPRAEFEAPEVLLKTDEIDALFNHVARYYPANRSLTALGTSEALNTVLLGQLPTRGQIAALEEVFGRDLAKALLSKRTLGKKAFENVMDAANLPRTLVTAFDASAPLRQGVMLAAGRPKQWTGSLVPMIRAMASPKYADAVEEAIANGKNAELRARAGVYIAPSSASGALAAREEAFMSRLANRIPGVGGSERGYRTFLNKLRSDVFDSIVDKWDDAQRTDANLKDLGNWINAATGRGRLPGNLDKIGGTGSALFFSPRFVASRIDAPLQLLDPSTSMLVRKEIVRDLTAFVGTGVAVLTLGQMGGLWDVEMDPRSSDFGKARVGPTRWDFWGGNQQIARFVAQMITGQRKTTSTGEMVGLGRDDVLGRFIQSKLSPQAGLALDLLKGETYNGDEITASKKSLRDQVFQRLTPLFMQDITEAIQEDGPMAGLRAAPSGLGVSTTTYLSTREMADQVASDMFPGKSYVELNASQKREVRDDPRYKEWVSQFDENLGPITQRVNNAFRQQESVSNDLQAALRGKVEAGLEGEDLRRAISQFKQDNYKASDWVLSEDVRTYLDAKNEKAIASGEVKPEDIFAQRYWATDAPENEFGEPDFDAQAAERKKVLAEARRAGVDVAYITGRGEGAYRKAYADPVVAAAVAEYDAAQERIRESGYWELREKAWAQVSGLPGVNPGETYSDFRDRITDITKQGLIDSGWAPEAAWQEAEEQSGNLKAITAFNDDVYKPAFLYPWIEENPQAAYDLWKMGYYNPDKEMEPLLNYYRQEGIVK